MSERITFTADDETLQILEAVEQREHIDSTAAAVRECITEYAHLQNEYDAIQHVHAREIAALEQTIERLRNEKRVLTDAYQLNEETTALVKRRKDKEDASIVERVKWWAFGRE